MDTDTLRVPKAPGSSSLCSPEPVPVSAHPGNDPSRKCLTPEAHYSFGSRDSGMFGMDGRRVLVVELRFPFEITDWVEGNAAIADTPEGVDPLGDADKLRRYDERAAERKRISDLVHDQMEAVGADCYRVLLERDARIGEDRVDYGVRHARWRRTREGGRPVPTHEPEDHWSRRIGEARSAP